MQWMLCATSPAKRVQQQLQGSGLGLPIVEEIAVLHGGQLILQRGANDQGFCAIMTLPVLI